LTAVDTNILVYAYRQELPQYQIAEKCLRLLAEGSTKWAIPWPCIHEFLGVVTNPKVFRPPSPMMHAMAQIDAWRESPSLALISETEAHWSYLKQLLTDGNVIGPKTHDARIAAICHQHGVTRFLSADRDFSRFPELNIVNPLTI
jgi:hypothetical protein